MTPPKKVLFFHANNREVGGADYCMFKMAKELKGNGFSPVVIMKYSTPIVSLYEQAGVPVHIFPIVRLQKNRSLMTLLSYPIAIANSIIILRRFIRSAQIDLVHTNDLLDFYANLAARISGVPSIQHIRMILEPSRLQKLLSFLSAAFSSHIICVSKAVQQTMFPDREENISVVYDWLDMEAVKHTNGNASLHTELGLAKTTSLVGCVGRIEAWKGQHVFLAAANLLAPENPNLHFVIVGSATPNKEDYLEELKKNRALSPYKNQISFLGQRSDIANIMRNCSIMVHASTAPEPFGLVVMEAMSCGTVVVGANDGGVREQIEDGVNGYLYQPGNPQDMASKISAALENPELSEMGSLAQGYVTKKFAKKPNLNHLISIYREL